MKKRIYVANTGGTMGMKWTSQGWQPDPGRLESEMKAMSAFAHARAPEYIYEEFDPLLDSSNMSPRDWQKIARSIADHYDEFDGFVVLHGTDTMSYTASALAFMLENLSKPVILTGSQVPLCEPRNDAYSNLVTSLLLAAHHTLPEVMIFFHDVLLRGCRSVKVNVNSFGAFASPNFPPLATAGIEITIHRELWAQPTASSSEPLRVQEQMDPYVGVLWLFPGITGTLVRNFLQPPIKGVVLKAFGTGNGPSQNQSFLEALREATDRGVVIVSCSQCLTGVADLTSYATGSALAAAGAISGFDMTTEAALTKLSYLFGKGLPASAVRDLVSKDLRGELTAEPPPLSVYRD